MRFWLEWGRDTMNVRDLSVKFTSYAHYIASREWTRERSKLPVLICVAPDIARGAADAASGSGQTHVSSWIDGVDNHQGALGRARATNPHLVAEEITEQPSSTVWQCAQTVLVRCDSRKVRQVRRWVSWRFLSCRSMLTTWTEHSLGEIGTRFEHDLFMLAFFCHLSLLP